MPHYRSLPPAQVGDRL